MVYGLPFTGSSLLIYHHHNQYYKSVNYQKVSICLRLKENMDGERQYSLAEIEKILKKRAKKIEGSDTDGKEYSGITALWKYIFPEFRKTANKKAKTSHDGSDNCGEWYSKANEYWESEENCPITDGN